MPSDKNTKKAMLSVMFMFIILLSYGPVNDELGVLAVNYSTNPVILFLDSWFGIFWAMLVVFFIGSAIYYIIF